MIYKQQTVINDRQKDTVTFKPLKVSNEIRGYEYLRNLLTFCIIESCQVSFFTSTLVTGIVHTQSVSICWKSPSMLMAPMMVLSSGTGCLGQKTDVADDLSVSETSAWMQHPRSFVKTWEKHLMMSLVCSIIAFWTRDLETALQIELSGMSEDLVTW